MALLSLLIAFIYLQTFEHDFIILDDSPYIYNNHSIAAGFSVKSIQWAFTAFYQSNWHPLTWISHLIDISVFGFNPSYHHLHNVLLHSLNSFLMFLILYRITGASGKSLFVAALFAVHPLRVESVAWVSERKDVLSAFLGFISLYSYIVYCQNKLKNKLIYIVTLFMYVFSLMAKPTLVTLPCLLLLLDWWPLGRWKKTESRILILEKLPFVFFSILSSIITLIAQQQGGSVVSLQNISLFKRLGNVAVSYIWYLKKLFVPVDLVFFYPFPRDLHTASIVASTAILLVITFVFWKNRGKNPELSFGWAWFLLSLLPMIGIVQVGDQAFADRYSYIPTIGLLVALVWAGERLTRGWRFITRVCCNSIGVVLVIVYCFMAHKQVKYWKNDISLYNHAITVNPDNYIAMVLIGDKLRLEKRCEEAVGFYTRSMQTGPKISSVFNNIAICNITLGRVQDAIPQLRMALLLKPNYADAWFNLGIAREMTGELHEAESMFIRALSLNPNDAGAFFRLGKVLLSLDRKSEAEANFRQALWRDPSLNNVIQELLKP